MKTVRTKSPERHRFLLIEVGSIRSAMWNALRQGRQVHQSTKDELTRLEKELATYEK